MHVLLQEGAGQREFHCKCTALRFYRRYAVDMKLTGINRQGAHLQEIHFSSLPATLPFNFLQHENKEIDTNIRIPILLNWSITSHFSHDNYRGICMLKCSLTFPCIVAHFLLPGEGEGDMRTFWFGQEECYRSCNWRIGYLRAGSVRVARLMGLAAGRRTAGSAASSSQALAVAVALVNLQDRSEPVRLRWRVPYSRKEKSASVSVSMINLKEAPSLEIT